jgi:Multiple myeloma tumor-associated
MSRVPGELRRLEHKAPPWRRWQKNKDILWYTREKGADEAQQRAEELAAIKAREEDLMAEVCAGPCCNLAASPQARVAGLAQIQVSSSPRSR